MWESTAYLKTVAIAKIAHKGRLPRRYAPRNDGTTLNYIIPFFHSAPYRDNRRKGAIWKFRHLALSLPRKQRVKSRARLI